MVAAVELQESCNISSDVTLKDTSKVGVYLTTK